MNAFLKGLLVCILLVTIACTGFVLAVKHPSTRGPLRCWIQETFYTQDRIEAPQGTPVIEVVTTTEPVEDMCDAADDPAIWVSDTVPGGALVLGTNKQSSLNVYDMKGRLLSQAAEIGAPNNVDMRASGSAAIAMVSDKDDGEIEAFTIDGATGGLTPLPGAPFPAKVEDEVYGLCLARSTDALSVFTTDKSGLIVQYHLSRSATGYTLKPVRELRVETQPEGCVVDDQAGALFVGEEDVGIWRFDASATAGRDATLIAATGPEGVLAADVEGLALYRGGDDGAGYLIASSQGDSTYAVFDLAPPHAFRGRFQLRYQGELIGDTDGLDVTASPVGTPYPKGLLVVQDGLIRDSAGQRRKQRFAYVSWEDVENALGL